MTTMLQHVSGTASFEYFRDSALWYRTSDTNLLFPVPVTDVGTATFPATEKGVHFMRWIRKYLNTLAAA